MAKVDGKTPATIISVAHLDDEERALVLGVLLEEKLTWVRSLSGSARLHALVVFDEVYGFIPPHPASPPTKRPLVALMEHEEERHRCATEEALRTLVRGAHGEERQGDAAESALRMSYLRGPMTQAEIRWAKVTRGG